jgi:hypothetical protein
LLLIRKHKIIFCKEIFWAGQITLSLDFLVNMPPTETFQSIQIMLPMSFSNSGIPQHQAERAAKMIFEKIAMPVLNVLLPKQGTGMQHRAVTAGAQNPSARERGDF